MKALSFASIVALALAGVACSESPPATEDAVETPPAEVEQTPVSAPAEDSGFNLDLFGDDSGDDGFNIGLEDSSERGLGDFDFGDDTRGESLLSDIPDISAPVLPEDEEAETVPTIPELPEEEDEILRLPN